jgi:hypothetical protein
MSLFVGIVAGARVAYQVELLKIKERIQEIIDYTVRFHSLKSCGDFIELIPHDYILLIITENQLQEISTSNIHLQEISTSNIHLFRHVQIILLFDPIFRVPSEELLRLQQLSYKLREPAIPSSFDFSSRYTSCSRRAIFSVNSFGNG